MPPPKPPMTSCDPLRVLPSIDTMPGEFSPLQTLKIGSATFTVGGKTEFLNRREIRQSFERLPKGLLLFLANDQYLSIIVLDSQEFGERKSSCGTEFPTNDYWFFSSRENALILNASSWSKDSTLTWLDLSLWQAMGSTLFHILDVDSYPDLHSQWTAYFYERRKTPDTIVYESTLKFFPWFKILEKTIPISRTELLAQLRKIKEAPTPNKWISTVPPDLSRFVLPTRSQTGSFDLDQLAKKGLQLRLGPFDVLGSYVGVERNQDELHSATMVWSSDPINRFATRIFVDTMTSFLPESFFLTNPRWNMRFFFGFYGDYQKEKFIEESAIDVGLVAGGALDFSFAYFSSTLLVQTKTPLLRDLRANEQLRPEDLSTEIALTYNFLEDTLRFGTRFYLSGGISPEELLVNNLLFTLEWDL